MQPDEPRGGERVAARPAAMPLLALALTAMGLSSPRESKGHMDGAFGADAIRPPLRSVQQGCRRSFSIAPP
jgi:hypothetical protein